MRASFAVLAVLALLALGAAATPPSGRQPVYPRNLPAGAGHDIAQRSCLVCHSAMLITQQHKDSTAWGKTVRQMQTWGVRLSAAESDSLLAYLTAHFGPRTR